MGSKPHCIWIATRLPAIINNLNYKPMTAKEELKIANDKLHIIRILRNYKEEYKKRLDNVSSNQEYDTVLDAISKFEKILSTFIEIL